MSKSVSAPPPPGLTREERDLIDKQGYTLDQFNNLLSDESIQKKETQGILKNISGLYKPVDVPAGPDSISYGVNAGPAGAYIGGNRGFLTPDQIKSQFDKPTANFLLKYATPGKLAANGGTRGVQEAFENLKALGEGNSKLKDYGIDETEFANDIKGTAFAKEIKVPGSAARTDYTLDQEAVNNLKDRIQKNQQYDQGIRDDATGFIDQFVKENLSPEKSALQQKQEEIGLLQADRLEKALKGELPVSPALTQRKSQDFQTLKEQLARQGHVITGDNPDEAQGFSTPAIQSLESFKKTYGLLEDQERRGELDSGTQANIAQYGLLSSDATNKLNQALTLRSLAPSSDPSLGFLGGASDAGPATLLPYYSNLSSGYGQAQQPFQFNRSMAYNTGVQNSANAAAGNASVYQLLGTALGSGAALFALSSKKYKKNIKKQKASDEKRILTLLTKTGTYTYDYKFEPTNLRPNHVGVIVEESPREIVAPDGIHLDVVNYLGALHSSVRALNREVQTLRRKVA